MQDLRVTKNVKTIMFEGICGKIEAEKKFPETMTCELFETNSSVHVEQCKT